MICFFLFLLFSFLAFQDREKRNLKDIHRHFKNAQKCIEWAGKVLDRYTVSAVAALVI